MFSVFTYFGENNNGVEFFVESEPEQAIVYVRARGNLSLEEKDALVTRAETDRAGPSGIKNAFSFAGDGGLNTDASGAQAPKDTIGQVQLETIPWEDRADRPDLDGDLVLERAVGPIGRPRRVSRSKSCRRIAVPASGKPVHLRLKADDWDALLEATHVARARSSNRRRA